MRMRRKKLKRSKEYDAKSDRKRHRERKMRKLTKSVVKGESTE